MRCSYSVLLIPFCCFTVTRSWLLGGREGGRRERGERKGKGREGEKEGKGKEGRGNLGIPDHNGSGGLEVFVGRNQPNLIERFERNRMPSRTFNSKG